MKKNKLNIIDITVIIIILIMIFAAVIKFSNYNDSSEETAKIDTINYEIKLNNVRDYTVNALVSGDTVYDTLTNVEIGKIVDKIVTPAKIYDSLNDGTIIETQIPNKYDIILKIQTNGLINDIGYFANNTVELKVGSEKTIETLYVKTTGKISKIEHSL